MIHTFGENVRRELIEDRAMLQKAMEQGFNNFDEYNRKVGELRGIDRALRIIDETLKAYELDESKS